MTKISLALVTVALVGSAMLTPSLIVRAQGTTRFEYARVSPYSERTPVPNPIRTGPNSKLPAVLERTGYRACIAGSTGWACQEFKPTTDTSSTDALRAAFVYL